MRRLVIAVTALTLVLTACAGGDDPEVGSDAPEDTEETDAEDADGPDDGDGDDGDDDTSTDEDVEPEDGDDDADGESDDDTTDEDGTDGDTTNGDTTDADDAANEPDPAALEDPCADEQGREDEAFLELVAPVDDQNASEELDIVGCANVPEGTVQYRLLDGDGATLDEGFTTADCGGPCLGEFRETVALDSAAGEPVVHVQVFWEDLSDGGERGLTERIVVLE